jgi:ParB family chromosome partitioning protein
MENKKRALGRGLEQLFNNENIDLDSFEKSVYETATREEIVDINLNELRANPYQPRQVFDDDALHELADSIKEHGVFQPIIVKRSIKGYEIIAGERRVRASKLAGKDTIPAIIRNLDDNQMMEIALLENLQRENLSAIEEATAYKQMIEKLGITQEELSTRVGKSRSHVTNILGLLRLPQDVQELVTSNQLSMAHARVLSKLENDDKIRSMARDIIDNKIPVRELEYQAKSEAKKVKTERHAPDVRKDYLYVEELLKERLGTKVKVRDSKIEINFANVADLNRILDILNIRG